MEPTVKLYYQNRKLLRATATVLLVQGTRVVTDLTPFYPEGGGQDGDRGLMVTKRGTIKVVDTKQEGGTPVVRQDLPVVAIHTVIVHYVESDATDLIQPGDEVELIVDQAHRKGCKTRHTETHEVLAVVKEAAERASESALVVGCSIHADHARLDFATELRLGAELGRLEVHVNEMIDSNARVEITPVPDVDGMFIWDVPQLKNPYLRQPCGGLHLETLGEAGTHVTLRRKRVQRGVERIYLAPTAPINVQR